jgi:hypothetical protein
MDVRIVKEARNLSKKIIFEAGKIARDRFDNFTRLDEKDTFGKA